MGGGGPGWVVLDRKRRKRRTLSLGGRFRAAPAAGSELRWEQLSNHFRGKNQKSSSYALVALYPFRGFTARLLLPPLQRTFASDCRFGALHFRL
jgi:hypothetical protein